jgi:hypothetical protein
MTAESGGEVVSAMAESLDGIEAGGAEFRATLRAKCGTITGIAPQELRVPADPSNPTIHERESW